MARWQISVDWVTSLDAVRTLCMFTYMYPCLHTCTTVRCPSKPLPANDALTALSRFWCSIVPGHGTDCLLPVHPTCVSLGFLGLSLLEVLKGGDGQLWWYSAACCTIVGPQMRTIWTETAIGMEAPDDASEGNTVDEEDYMHTWKFK